MTGTDLKLDLEGKTVLKDGDFDLELDLNEAVTNRMLRTSIGSWEFDPEIGIGLQDYAGRRNDATTGHEIEDAVVAGLRLVDIEGQCVVYPISRDSIAVQVLVFTEQGVKKLPYTFRYEGGLVTYIESEVEDAGYPTREPANKYDRRARRT